MARGASDEGVGTTTIGFGEDFDEELLTAIADVAAGNAYFAASPEEAPGIFAQEFEGLTALVAQNLSVEIRPGADVQMLGVLNEYPVVSVAGGLQAQIGDAYAEERRRVVFELAVPKLADARRRPGGRGRRALRLARRADRGARAPSAGHRERGHGRRSGSSDARQRGGRGDRRPEVRAGARRGADAGTDRRFRRRERLLRETAEDLRKVAPGSPRGEELEQQAAEMEEHATRFATEGEMTSLQAKRMRYESWERRRKRR